MVERAISFYDEIVHRKLPPTEEIYINLIHACAGRKDLCIPLLVVYFASLFSIIRDNYNKAFEFFAKMKEDGYHPDKITYNNLLLNCANRGDHEVKTMTTKTYIYSFYRHWK